MNHIDPASPLVLDTKEVGRRPGSMKELTRTVGAPADFGTDVLMIAQGQPLELELRLESVMEGVLVTGTVRASATGACVRCLDPIDVPVDQGFQELFVWADRASHHQEVGDTDDEDESYRIENDLIDLEPMLRDAVVTTLPFQPVCREDCPGLCSQCGFRLEDDPEHAHEVIDPRWAALGQLQGLGATATDETKHDQEIQEKRN
ncbi:YceD family protein [Kribbia dieselivorans]|uniref:YceD family protein n=1 Tax=Kribbia dieselivorans TaxID=331526 RepID=UPI0008385262|nr:DUF177 domain-containing protein [Kribbia dieselivorans]